MRGKKQNTCISDGPNSHPKASSRVEDILPKDHYIDRCGSLIAPLEMWVGNGPMETTQAQHLRYTTARWTIFTGYISRKLFI